MKFFGRETEIAELHKIREHSKTAARMTVVTGRRRVGKTELITHALSDGKTPFIYFLITRAPQTVVCENLQAEIARVFARPMPGRIERFVDIFRFVMEKAETTPLTLVVDEFQEFDRTAPEVYGEVAGIWDQLHKTSRINLVFCGSVNRLMHKVFFSYAEPLYGRNTGRLDLKPFPVSTLKEIFAEYAPAKRKASDLLDLWTLTGGVARYVEQLMDDGAVTRKKMFASVFKLDSSYLDEGLSSLVQEFGKEYGTYFSIMSSIASGHTEYSQIKNDVGTEVGAHLAKLENEYGLVRRKLPMFAAQSSKRSVYEIDDCFFRYWFRFVWKNMHLKELQRFDVMRELAEGGYEVFSGHALEQYFRWKFIEEMKYTRMDSWWDRKGENEIDLVCEDEVSGTLDFFEIKRDAKRIDIGMLREKSAAFFAKNPQLKSRTPAFKGLSLLDM